MTQAYQVGLRLFVRDRANRAMSFAQRRERLIVEVRLHGRASLAAADVIGRASRARLIARAAAKAAVSSEANPIAASDRERGRAVLKALGFRSRGQVSLPSTQQLRECHMLSGETESAPHLPEVDR